MSTNKEQLNTFYQAWQESEVRLRMARETLTGAEREALVNNARFNGAVELAAGGPANWSFNPDDGVTFELAPPPKEIESPAQPVDSAPAPGPHGTRMKEK